MTYMAIRSMSLVGTCHSVKLPKVGPAPPRNARALGSRRSKRRTRAGASTRKPRLVDGRRSERRTRSVSSIDRDIRLQPGRLRVACRGLSWVPSAMIVLPFIER